MRNEIISGYNAKINLRGIFWRTSNSMKFTLHPWGIKLRPSVGLGGLCQICFSLPGQVAAPQQVADLLQSCLANGQSSHNVCTLSTWRRSRPTLPRAMIHKRRWWEVSVNSRSQPPLPIFFGHLLPVVKTGDGRLFRDLRRFHCLGQVQERHFRPKKMKPAAKHSFAKQTPCAAWEFLRGPWTSSNAGGRGCFVETALRQAITP